MSVFLSHLVLSRFGLVLWIIHINIYIRISFYISSLILPSSAHQLSNNLQPVEFQSNFNTSGFIYHEDVPFLLRGCVFGSQIRTNILHLHLQLLGSAKSFDPFGPAKVDLAVFQVSHHPRSPLGLRKNPASRWKTSYWLFNRDPYNALLTWVV